MIVAVVSRAALHAKIPEWEQEEIHLRDYLDVLLPRKWLIISVLVLNETLSTGRWTGFVLVWIALVVFAVDGVRHTRRSRTAASSPAANPVSGDPGFD